MSKRGKVLKNLKVSIETLIDNIEVLSKLEEADKAWVTKKLEKWEKETKKISSLQMPSQNNDLPF
jgi:hypothetical protein